MDGIYIYIGSRVKTAVLAYGYMNFIIFHSILKD